MATPPLSYTLDLASLSSVMNSFLGSYQELPNCQIHSPLPALGLLDLLGALSTVGHASLF